MAAWAQLNYLATWPGIVILTLCTLVRTTAQDLEACSAVKYSYGKKGFSRNDVPNKMIPGKFSQKFLQDSRVK